MRRLIALIPLAVFGWLAYAVAFRAVPPGGLAAAFDELTRVLGPGLTGGLLLSIGVVLYWLIVRRQNAPD